MIYGGTLGSAAYGSLTIYGTPAGPVTPEATARQRFDSYASSHQRLSSWQGRRAFASYPSNRQGFASWSEE